jgi:flagellar assembly protein FliH
VPTTYLRRGADLESNEAERVAAARQGYDDGYAAGLAKAGEEAVGRRDATSRQAASALSALARAIAEAQEADLRMRAEIQAAAPKLAFALLEALLGREVELAAHPVREAIARALALDEGTQPATVRLNPIDVDALAEFELGRVVSVLADPAVERGGAVVEVGQSTLDGQLGPALERVRQVLLGPPEPGTRDDRAA